MKSILVVDDEGPLREILEKILKREGFSITTAANGREALKRFQKRRFDLLVTDLRMPGLGGPEMLKEMLRLQPEVPVILITGYPLDPEIQKRVAEGRYLFFPKPFDNRALVEKIKEVLAGPPL